MGICTYHGVQRCLDRQFQSRGCSWDTEPEPPSRLAFAGHGAGGQPHHGAGGGSSGRATGGHRIAATGGRLRNTGSESGSNSATLLLYVTFFHSVLYFTLLYSTLLYSPLSSILYSTLLYSPLSSILYSTLLYSPLSSILYSTPIPGCHCGYFKKLLDKQTFEACCATFEACCAKSKNGNAASQGTEKDTSRMDGQPQHGAGGGAQRHPNLQTFSSREGRLRNTGSESGSNSATILLYVTFLHYVLYFPLLCFTLLSSALLSTL